MKAKKACGIAAAAVLIMLSLAGLTRLLMPKYMGQVVEGAFIAEYYEDESPHDLLILGDCEVYENISPITLWQKCGITSYIRGSAQQLIPQSYYLLLDTLRYEKPKAVLLSISAMQESVQTMETYNRMTLDGMRWSKDKWDAIEATKMPDEHMIEYIFPLLRFHSRWNELEKDDFRYYWHKRQVTHNGYYLRADIRPVGVFPTPRRLANYRFSDTSYEYLDLIRKTCEDEGITLILFKAPSLYPAWYDEWEKQIEDYAGDYGILYLNALASSDEIGIDFDHDTYDGGLHMNVYGAEKVADWLGPLLAKNCGLPDHRGDAGLEDVWQRKTEYYEEMKISQEQEFARLGYLRQFAGENAD